MKYDCLLIDGSGFIYRAYYGYPKLTRSDGTPVGAVYGFCSMLLSLLKSSQSDYCAVAFDNSRHTFRSERYPEYKSNRAAVPDDLIPQFGLIREACKAFGVTVVAQDGVEADDLIATFSARFGSVGKLSKVVSCDKDLLQLASDKVHIFDPLKSKYMTEDEILKKFDVLPGQIIDYLTMVGDASDNVPGVPGVGPKTAAKLLKKFGSIDAIFENLDDVSLGKNAAKFSDNKEQILLSRWLVTLKNDVDTEVNNDDLKFDGITYSSLSDFFLSNGFNALLRKCES